MSVQVQFLELKAPYAELREELVQRPVKAPVDIRPC